MGESALGNTLKCSTLLSGIKVQQVGVYEFSYFLLPYDQYAIDHLPNQLREGKKIASVQPRESESNEKLQQPRKAGILSDP